MYVEEPWKGSVPEVHQKRTTDGSDLKVIDPKCTARFASGVLLGELSEKVYHAQVQDVLTAREKTNLRLG